MKGKSAVTFAGTIVSAILASACCIGPLILAGLGVFSCLERYRPLFILITFALIGTAFYFAYRKEKTADACCEIKKNRIKKIILWVIAVIAFALLLFPYLF